jgi:DNA-binding LacI/PurR family transcriptional regulator
VEAAARDLGYAGPSPKGRLLMGGKVHAIGFIPAGEMSVESLMRSPYLREVFTGVAQVCDERGANLLVVSGVTRRKDWAIANALVDGFILGHVEEIGLVSVRRKQVPYVVLEHDAGPDVASVRVDGRKGACLAARHLLELGHRKFAIVSVRRRRGEPIWHGAGLATGQLHAGYPLDHEKLAGYLEALAEAGINASDVPVVEAFPPSPYAEAGARMLFDAAPDVTAILAMSDKNAIAVLTVANERGTRVPEDVSVVGFDGVAEAARSSPPLTTIAQPLAEKGILAARMLFDGGPVRQIVQPVTLVVRHSTSPPRR